MKAKTFDLKYGNKNRIRTIKGKPVNTPTQDFKVAYDLLMKSMTILAKYRHTVLVNEILKGINEQRNNIKLIVKI